jgi:2-polyprenyl-6-methoxyphenol hydroxylase-like FAD-dependent oxidoreductase
VSYKQRADGIVARFQHHDGTQYDKAGDALIGADGIHSTLRASLHPDDPPIRWNDTQMWRGAADWPAFDGDSMVVAGDAVAEFVLYPISPGETSDTRLTNWVIYAKVAEAGEPPPQRENWCASANMGHFDSWRNGCICHSSMSDG